MSSPKDLDLIGSCKSAQQSRRDSEELSMDGLDPEIQNQVLDCEVSIFVSVEVLPCKKRQCQRPGQMT